MIKRLNKEYLLKTPFKAFFLCCILFSFVSLESIAADTQQATGFVVQPDRCIALRQGQTCYQKVTFSWQTPTNGEYCLYEKSTMAPLLCWIGSQEKSYSMEFASESNITYQIISKDQQDILSEVVVEVAWVYKSSRKSFSRWRLF